MVGKLGQVGGERGSVNNLNRSGYAGMVSSALGRQQVAYNGLLGERVTKGQLPAGRLDHHLRVN